jgi:hypothetical protein
LWPPFDVLPSLGKNTAQFSPGTKGLLDEREFPPLGSRFGSAPCLSPTVSPAALVGVVAVPLLATPGPRPQRHEARS